MRAHVRKDGIVVVKGELEIVPAYLGKRRGGGYWTGYPWVGNLKKDFPDLRLSGKENYQRIQHRLQRVRRILETGAYSKDPVFEDPYEFPLFKSQRQAATYLVAQRRAYLGDIVGFGKTLSAVSAFVYLKLKGLAENCLIVTLGSIKLQWKYEIMNALREEHHGTFRTQVVDGPPSRRPSQYRSGATITIVTYDTLKRDVKSFLTPQRDVWDVVVMDESWKVAKASTGNNKGLRGITRQAKYVWSLNASVIENKYEDLYGNFLLMDPEVFVTMKNFQDRFVWRHPVHTFVKRYVRIPELKRRISCHVLRRTKKDMGDDVPRITASVYWVKLTGRHKKEYDRIKKEYEGEVEGANLAKTCCLFADGVPTKKTPKYQELLRLLREEIVYDKAIIFCESRKYIEALRGLLLKHYVVRTVTGGDSARIKFQTQSAFMDGNVQLLLCTKAGEAGMNLQAADTVINLDFPWNPQRLTQRVGRVRPYLGGKDRRVRVLNILTEDTIESAVVGVIQKKTRYLAEIFDENPPDLTGTLNPEVFKDQL